MIANRLWHYHFGRGLVATPSDFGRTGLPPTHPALLDWLATELIRGDWRLKRMHKLLLMSQTYQQSSKADQPRGTSVDPGNRWLWRQNLRRIEAEVIRDTILAANGRLNLKAGGRGIFPQLSAEVLSTQSRPGSGWGKSDEAERNRRSIYIYVKRTLTVPLMDSFDQPTPDKPDPQRSVTTIAPQALMLLNSAFIDEQSRHFAERLVRDVGDDINKQIVHAYRLALARDPTPREQSVLRAFLDRQQQEKSVSSLDPQREALVRFCRLVFNLNEFVYVD